MAAAVGAPPAEDVRLISQEDHARFASIVREHTGIKLGENKRQLLSSRLQKRMRVHGLQTFGAYWDYLNDHHESDVVFPGEPPFRVPAAVLRRGAKRVYGEDLVGGLFYR